MKWISISLPQIQPTLVGTKETVWKRHLEHGDSYSELKRGNLLFHFEGHHSIILFLRSALCHWELDELGARYGVLVRHVQQQPFNTSMLVNCVGIWLAASPTVWTIRYASRLKTSVWHCGLLCGSRHPSLGINRRLLLIIWPGPRISGIWWL